MVFVERDGQGNISGWARYRTAHATEAVADDAAELVSFINRPRPIIRDLAAEIDNLTDELGALKDRVAALEGIRPIP